MISRASIVALVAVMAAIGVASSSARQPPTGTAMYVVRHDPRLCPSPRCGGYWLTIANGVRTRCADGARRVRCYVGRAVDGQGRPLRADVAEGALVRGAIDDWRSPVADLDELVASAAYAPAGTAPVSGGFYRVKDSGIRCVRAPCFSYTVTQVNGMTRGPASTVDLDASKATAAQVARARAALQTKNGLYARGGFSSGLDGGRVFHAFRLYLRAPLPRA